MFQCGVISPRLSLAFLLGLPAGPAKHLRYLARGDCSPKALPSSSPILPTSLYRLSLHAHSLKVNRAHAFLSQGKHTCARGCTGRGNFTGNISVTDQTRPKEQEALSGLGSLFCCVCLPFSFVLLVASLICWRHSMAKFLTCVCLFNPPNTSVKPLLFPLYG